jgi:hypothetical protein
LLTYVGTRAVAAPPKTILDTIGDKAAAKPGATQLTIPAPNAPIAGETAPPSTPADSGATGAAASAPAATPAPATDAAPAPTLPAQSSAPAQPAPANAASQGAAPK